MRRICTEREMRRKPESINKGRKMSSTKVAKKNVAVLHEG